MTREIRFQSHLLQTKAFSIGIWRRGGDRRERENRGREKRGRERGYWNASLLLAYPLHVNVIIA